MKTNFDSVFFKSPTSKIFLSYLQDWSPITQSMTNGYLFNRQFDSVCSQPYFLYGLKFYVFFDTCIIHTVRVFEIYIKFVYLKT